MPKALVVKNVDFSTNKVTTVSFEGSHTTSVEVIPSTLVFTALNETKMLSCTVTPSDSVDPVVWSTSNSNVATVSNGAVTSVGVGTCTITATSGSYSDTCAVEVAINAYLEGTAYPRTLTDPAGSGNNALTKTMCDIGHPNLGSYEEFKVQVCS